MPLKVTHLGYRSTIKYQPGEWDNVMDKFGYKIGYVEPSDDSEFETLYSEPSDVITLLPYGIPNRTSDGSILYTSKGKLTIQFPGLLYRVPPPNVTGPTYKQTVTYFYQQWRLAKNMYRGQFWFNLFIPEQGKFGYRRGIVKWPDWSGKLKGIGIVNFQIEIVGLDVNLQTFEYGSIPTVIYDINDPYISYVGNNSGDQDAGGFGYGTYGGGYFGEGQA
jgi:hypothetical protein